MLEINRKNRDGKSPFHYLEIVEVLMKDARLEINSKNHDGDTSFYSACNNGHFTIVEFLMKDTRVEINSQNNIGTGLLFILLVYLNVLNLFNF